MICPDCRKSVEAFPNGSIRPHQVPIEARRDPRRSERCKAGVR